MNLSLIYEYKSLYNLQYTHAPAYRQRKNCGSNYLRLNIYPLLPFFLKKRIVINGNTRTKPTHL